MSSEQYWYKDAIIYQLHVKAFFDFTGDGVGDFRGLTEQLDYVRDLGVNTLWLLPFYPSPLRDDGYDIADYRNVHPAYGTIADFRHFVKAAHARDLRVITELVVNHTSDQHPWFQRARTAKPGSAHRDFYVWSETDDRYHGTRIIFTDTETSNWAWDPVAHAYYWHRFFSHQPDLNFDNPRVVQAVVNVMRFWLDVGVDGFRLDAVPYLCEREGTNNENLPETHAILKQLRRALDERYQHRLLLAEANQWPEDVRQYFGDEDECHMAFHFPVMPRIYMAVAQEDRYPIVDIMRQTPDIPESCQWAIFLRNHDELTLEMVTDRERDYLWNFYAADTRARVNVGIRRRLAPLLENDRRKIELLNSLLMSLPGTPIIYYGDEIGMGDNIFLGDRDAVRTPMQWTPDRNGGFSRADPAGLYLPAIMDPVYGYEAVNVEAQSRSPSSLLNWMKRLIDVRKAHRAFGRGSISFLFPGNRKVLVYLREYEGETLLCVANLSRASQPVELDLAAYRGRAPVELLGRTVFPTIGELPYFLTLPGYAFYWFLLEAEAEIPSWHEPYTTPVPELLTLVLPQGWTSLIAGPAHDALDTRIIPEFLPHQRWFGAKGATIKSTRISTSAMLSRDDREWLLALYHVTFDNRRTQDYFLPLATAWEHDGEDPLVALRPYSLARARKGPRLGVLYDALVDEDFARALLAYIREDARVPVDSSGELRFASTSLLRGATPESEGSVTVRRLGKEQSNTSIRLGETMILKAYRRVERGMHPEVEIGRFLTEVAHYPSTPQLLGSLEYAPTRGGPTALAILQTFVPNQGDGWTYTLEYLGRFLEEAAVRPPDARAAETDWHAAYEGFARTLGVRTAELHRAFATETTDKAFQAEPITPRDLRTWRSEIRGQAREALAALRRGVRSLRDSVREQADTLLARRADVFALIDAMLPDHIDAAKTRYHADFHLGQVLLVQNDVCILDFEGEPAKPLAARRAKSCPLRDVAGIVRSFNYAAWTAVFARSADRPHIFHTLADLAADWEERARTAFLEGYHLLISDCPSMPRDPGVIQNLLDVFILEKACYEICYEIANRPDWVRIPLQGVLRLLEAEE